MGTLALLLSSNVVRSINSLSIAAEAVLALIFIAIAIVFAAASGPHRWALKLNEIDYCSAQNNPHAALVYLAADFLGAGSAILERHTRPKHFCPRAMPVTPTHNREQVVISFFIRAPIKNMPILSATLLAVALVALQLGVIDPYIVDEISQVWKTVEVLPLPPPTTPRPPPPPRLGPAHPAWTR